MKYKHLLLLIVIVSSILIVLTEVRNPLYLILSKPEPFKTVLTTQWLSSIMYNAVNYSSRYYDSFMVIQNQSEWEQTLGKLRYNPNKLPPVDFSNATLICAFRGACKNTAYSIEVKYIGIIGDRIHVIVFKNNLEYGGAGQAVTHPTQIVSIAKTPLPVEFHVIDEFSKLWIDVPIVVIAISALVIIRKSRRK